MAQVRTKGITVTLLSAGLVAYFCMGCEQDSDDDTEKSDGAAKDFDDEDLDKERGVGSISHGSSRANLDNK